MRHRPEQTVLYQVVQEEIETLLVLREFARALSASYRRRARRHGPIRRARGGAVTFLQRFGDALNLNVHFHTLALDGVYLHYGEPRMRFLALPPPEDDEVRRLVERVARRVGRLLERLGLGPDAGVSEADPLATEQPYLATVFARHVSPLTTTAYTHPSDQKLWSRVRSIRC